MNDLISVGILAGGRSSRMGQDKADLFFQRKTFLEYQIEKFREHYDCLLSLGNSGRPYQGPCRMVRDEHRNIGPIEGIRQLLKAAHTPYVFICAVDMPLVPWELVAYMESYLSEPYLCYIPETVDGIHPLCGIYHRDVLPYVEQMIREGDYKLRNLLDRIPVKYIPIRYSCFSERILKNINTPAEYTQLLAPPLLAVSGEKNSGKTTLICRLIPMLKRDGYRIAVMKHDGHDYVIDHTGTDTWRFRQSGADRIGIYSNCQSTVMHYSESLTRETMAECFDGSDLILLEGGKSSSYPKIELVRKGIGSECPTADPGTVLAYVTDLGQGNMQEEIPVYSFRQIEEIYGVLHQYLQRYKQPFCRKIEQIDPPWRNIN